MTDEQILEHQRALEQEYRRGYAHGWGHVIRLLESMAEELCDLQRAMERLDTFQKEKLTEWQQQDLDERQPVPNFWQA